MAIQKVAIEAEAIREALWSCTLPDTDHSVLLWVEHTALRQEKHEITSDFLKSDRMTLNIVRNKQTKKKKKKLRLQSDRKSVIETRCKQFKNRPQDTKQILKKKKKRNSSTQADKDDETALISPIEILTCLPIGSGLVIVVLKKPSHSKRP